jgi:hypothetical protein
MLKFSDFWLAKGITTLGTPAVKIWPTYIQEVVPKYFLLITYLTWVALGLIYMFMALDFLTDASEVF